MYMYYKNSLKQSMIFFLKNPCQDLIHDSEVYENFALHTSSPDNVDKSVMCTKYF